MKPTVYANDEMRKPHPYDVLVGANIRRLRVGRGASQESLGAAISCCFQQVQKIESGKNRAGAAKLAIIASFLGCAVGDLFEGVGDRKASDRILASSNSQRNCLVVSAFNAIRCPKQQAAILALMRTMSEAEDE